MWVDHVPADDRMDHPSLPHGCTEHVETAGGWLHGSGWRSGGAWGAEEKKVVSSLLHQIEQMKAKLFIHTANMNLIDEINVGKFNTVIGDVVVYCHCYCCTNFLP